MHNRKENDFVILPEPESDLRLNLLVLTSDMVKILKKSKEFLFIDTLLEKFIERDKRRDKDLFYNSLTILFSLNAIVVRNHMVRLNVIDPA